MDNKQKLKELFKNMNNIKLLPNLLVFAEVAQSGSFTAAAARLKISKSAASQQVSRLEKQIGVQLLTRNTRGLALTSVGKNLLQRSELLKDQVELALQELVHADESPSGTFSVTLPHMMMRDIVAPALRQLCIEFPLIQPRLLVTDKPLDLIAENLDVAIYLGTPPDSNYRALPLPSVSEIFCATPTYVRQSGEPTTLADLANHSWISTAWQLPEIEIFSTAPSKAPTRLRLKPFATCNGLYPALELTTADMGYVLLPETVARPLLENGKLLHILKHHHGPVWPAHFVHPFQGRRPPHVTRFYQLVEFFIGKAHSKAASPARGG